MEELERKLDEIIANIEPIDKKICNETKSKWNDVAKPLYSLGKLEEMVIKLAGIQRLANPKVDKKCVLVFCADNGIVCENVTQTGQEVTAIVTENFAKGIATINSFARILGADVIPVDVGVNAKLDYNLGIVNKKVAFGTKNFAVEPAMSKMECEEAILAGIDMVRRVKDEGYELVITGEMGIGNTSTSSAILACLTDSDIEKVTGKGAGLSKEGIERKIEAIKRGISANKPDRNDVLDVLSKVGGFDICAMAGAFLGGAIYHIPVVVDGFISSVAAICAIKLNPLCKEYMFASHISNELAGKMAMDILDLSPVIDANMCLGEGTGGVLLASMFDYALAAYNEVADFEKIKVKHYEEYDS